MKKTVTFLVLILFNSFSFSQKINNKECKTISFKVALDDDNGSISNIREAPNGVIVLKLDNEIDFYTLNVIDFKNNWLKINSIESINYGYKISEFEGWIHNSIVRVSSRRDLMLRSEPNSDKIVGTIEQEIYGFKIIDVCSNWVKIEYENISGWIESKWLCGNPVTTCP